MNEGSSAGTCSSIQALRHHIIPHGVFLRRERATAKIKISRKQRKKVAATAVEGVQYTTVQYSTADRPVTILC
jgi:hypothetical protein